MVKDLIMMVLVIVLVTNGTGEQLVLIIVNVIRLMVMHVVGEKMGLVHVLVLLNGMV
jgi:hypothetical protein